MTPTGIPVLTSPQFDPGAGRVELTMPDGMTLAAIVKAAVPGATPADLRQCRVALVTKAGQSIIEPALWHAVRPRPGVHVVIRLIPGKNALRSVLSIVISIAAVALATAFGGPLGLALGFTGATAVAVGGALIATGVNLIGSLLMNALVPPVKSDNERRSSYTISGWRNRAEPDGAVPVIMGQIRYSPRFAAMSYTEIVGDWQYVRALFLFGEGELELSDFRIGETSIAEYDDVDLEVRYGLPGELPVSIYPRQIVEEGIGVELTRPQPRNAVGGAIDVIFGGDDDVAEEVPVVRTTGPDAKSASILLAWPAGLIRFNEEGKKRNYTVSIRIEQRRIEADEWQPVTVLDITASKTEGFYREHVWQFPSRGRWQIRLTRLTPESDDNRIQSRTVWAALQTRRPEYPIAYDRPLSIVAVRVRATHQLSGALDNFSALARRVCLDWDHVSATWIKRATSNPASLYRHALQSPANPKAVGNAGIDLAQLQDWHDFCRLKGLAYNRVLDQTGTSLRDVLTEIAAAGRATPRHDGMTWGVVIDRPSDLIVDHVSPRNSWGFSVSRTYAEQPHGLLVRFQDETNDFKEAQRIIRRPGHTGPIDLTEPLDLPGITNPAIIWREGLRRFHEAKLRPDVYQITQDGAARVATRGDTLALMHDVISRVQRVGRVRSVRGNLIELDEAVTIAPGETYGLRFRVYSGGQDSEGTSVVRMIEAEPGETDTLMLAGNGAMPLVDDLVYFGLAGRETSQVVVTRIEATEDMCTILRCVDAAPEIDALTDAAAIPAWSGRVGAEIADNLLQPSAPRFVSIVSGATGTGLPGGIEYLIEPGSGVISVSGYVVEHRLQGAASWTSIALPAANGGGQISGYGHGNIVDIRARGISAAGVAGPDTAIITLTVGAGDAAIPAPLDPDAVTVTTLPGGALVQLATGTDANTRQVQLYRSRTSTLARETDATGAPVTVSPQQSYSMSVGDLTRTNLFTGGGWTGDAGWTVAAGSLSHAPGSAGAVGRPLAAQTGRWYRVGFTVSDHAGGAVTPHLTGGSMRPGSAVSAGGAYADRIQAVTGNDRFEFSAGSLFDATVSEVLVYLETSACLAQGVHYLWIEPQNSAGIPGPALGPLMIEVV